MRIWLCAEEAAGLQTLRLLRGRGHDVVGVASSPAPGTATATVARAAQSAGIPVHPAASVRDPAFAATLRDHGVELLLNVHSLHRIAAPALEVPALGAFNLHPGRLPEYAGLDAASWAIFEDAAQHGVTLHWLTPDIDAGPIAYASEWPATPADTALAVNTRCVRQGLELVARLLDDAPLRCVQRLPQDLGARRYYRRQTPGGGRLDWRLPAAALERTIRACEFHPLAAPFPLPSTDLDGEALEVVQAQATRDPAHALPGSVLGDRVACSDFWLQLKLVRQQGRVCAASSVLRDGVRLVSGFD